MRYYNASTGSVIDVVCHVSGGDWVPLEEPKKKPAAAKKPPAKKPIDKPAAAKKPPAKKPVDKPAAQKSTAE